MEVLNRKETKQLRNTLRKNQTTAERVLWSRLRNKQMNGLKFFRQYGVGKYIADFYCPRIKLAIEIDGGGHYTDAGLTSDLLRDAAFSSLGITTLRFTNSEILNQLDCVLEKIWGLTPPSPLFKKEGEILLTPNH